MCLSGGEYCGDTAEQVAFQTAERLRETNRLLAIAEGLADFGQWRLEPDDELIERSPHASAILGMGIAEPLSPAQAFARIEPADRFGLLRRMVRALRGEPEVEYRARLIQRAGDECTILIRAHAVARDDGSDNILFGVIRDISREVESEAKLIAARDEAEAATLAKSEFLATMSHEIRTPMTGVLGMIDLIATANDEAERTQYLAAMRHSAQMLMSVLDSILDFSKAEAGRIAVADKCFNLVKLARQTVLLFGNAGSAKGISLEFESSHGTSPVVRGDPVRIQQVMSNFISNAIKFTKDGRVVVSVRARPGRKGHQRWRVAVRDTGEGISPPQLERLFVPFVQVGDPLTGGTGLGLAISQRLVEAMGGKTKVRSKPGCGSTFSFELDLPIGRASKASPARVVDSSSMPAERVLDVLIAEDHPINQMLIVAVVRRLGHRATVVGNGKRAAECALAMPYDCILMDMQMPVMDGVQATRAIRESGGANASVPIIALTADAAPERREFYANIGLSDFMTKPIDVDRMRHLLWTIAATPRAWRPPSPKPPTIDQRQLNDIRDSIGPVKLVRLLELAQSELADRPGLIREIAERQDFKRLRSEAHSFNGAVASFGLVSVALAARAVELAAPGAELELALGRLDGEAVRARIALAPLICGQPVPVAANG